MKNKRSPVGRAAILPGTPIYQRRPTSEKSRLDAVFSALSDPTRRAILDRLSHGEASVGELAKPFQISLPAITKHLHVLENAGLLSRKREGRMIKLHLDPTPLVSTATWMEEYRPLWETQLDSLSYYLDTLDKEKTVR